MKNIFCLSVAISFSLLSFSQGTPIVMGQNTFNATGYDNARSIIPTSDGGYLLSGSSNSPAGLDKTQNVRGSNGDYDYWVIKADAAFSKQWDADFGGTDDDFQSCLIQTADGGYLIGGSSRSPVSGDKTASYGNYDYWLIKTDTNGNKLWDKVYGGTSDDNLSGIIKGTDGGYLLAGTSLSGISGNKSQGSQGDDDYWVVKIDENGNKLWDKRFGGTDGDVCTAIDKTSDGGYVLGGYSWSGVGADKTEGVNNTDHLADYWVVKINSAGVKQWDHDFGGSGTDWLSTLKTTPDNGFVMGGRSDSPISGNKTTTSFGNDDFWIVKTDANGNKLWDQTFGGSEDDEPYSIVITAGGDYVFGGSSESGISGNKTSASWGNDDCWLVETDAAGQKQWEAHYGGTNADIIQCFIATPDNGFVLGNLSASLAGGDKNEASINSDYWLVKLSAPCASAVYYADGDADGYGDPAAPVCGQQPGYVANNLDCNDANGSVKPDAAEICNGIDDNCNGSVDDGIPYYYEDADNDGYGSPYVKSCLAQAGYISDNTDCNDANVSINPGTAEVCNNALDDNCDGQKDEGCTCEPPVNLRTKKIKSTSASARWDYTSVANEFDIQYKVNGTSGWTTVTANANNRDKKLKNLLPATKYTWRIKTDCYYDTESEYSKKVYFTTLSAKEISPNEDQLISFNLYPNPAADKITLTFEDELTSALQIKIYDLSGKEVSAGEFQNIAGNSTIELSVSTLPSGMYLVEVMQGQEKIIRQLVIQK